MPNTPPARPVANRPGRRTVKRSGALRNAVTGCAVLGLGLLAGTARAVDQEADAGEIQVTATRIPESADRVPAYITVLEGDDLRARHVADLRGALALVAGVEAPSGGDAGPAGTVPALWGLHEFDAFLLVVDGVPLGGAFNPAIGDLNLNDVDRIEVLKGSAPAMYGATAFVGVIQVIHFPAGAAARTVSVGYGSRGSWRGAAALVLPTIGGLSQSLSIDSKHDGFSDSRARVNATHGLYRAGGDLAGGKLRLDFDYTALRTVPPSPVPRAGAALNILTPLDANYNPLDARLDEDRYHGVIGYSRATPLGAWDIAVSLARSKITDVRGFLRPDLVNADSQIQDRTVDDDYIDTHVTTRLGTEANLTWGADLLYGRGRQVSRNGGYNPDLVGGGNLPRAADLHVDEINALNDRRLFVGQYAQLDWKIASRWDLNAGLRLNETSEHKRSAHIDGFDAAASTSDDRRRTVTRLSGMAGLTYRAWTSGANEAVVFADYRDTFKPAAIDFGPDNTPDILEPETARSYEIGLKGRLADGRLDYEIGAFLMDFKNLVVATTNEAGDHILQNAGGERLKGIEAEAHWRMTPDLVLTAAGAWHDTRFTRYIAAEGGENIDVSGNRLTLSPQALASFGVIYAPPEGLFGSATVGFVGPRFLDLANTARVGGYATVDAGVGFRRGRYSLAVNGTNLGDRRPPVTASEFGAQSFYRLVGRKVFVDLTAHF